MYRRLLLIGVLVASFAVVSCTNKRVQNPLSDVGSVQPDKVLFDRAMDAMKHNKFDVSRLALQTLINTYPDSEYVARAKLAVGDSWYAAGGSAAFAQAEAEYRDFITFFPNMAEAAEAQLKIANIHYQQMQKPDRDFTHARRAEEEYRRLVLEFPDSSLLPDAKVRLLEVQEVLAEREFRIGKFYFLRESWPAAVARLQSVVDAYPLYSGADETLFLIGQAFERQVENIRLANFGEVAKGKLLKQYSDQAAAAYEKILTRYPVMPRAAEAAARLQAMQYPVPAATAEVIAQNEREQASRSESGFMDKVWGNFSRRPDTAQAAKVGEPTLATPKATNATALVKATNEAVAAAVADPATSGGNSVSIETVRAGDPPANEPIPRSTSPRAVPEENRDTGIPELVPLADAESAPAATNGQAGAGTPAAHTVDAPAPAPEQVNEAGGSAAQAAASADAPAEQSTAQSSSSRPKKRKKLLKVF